MPNTSHTSTSLSDTPSSPLAIGAAAPDFTLLDQSGQRVRLHDLRGRWVVIFFYPKAFTPACTKEACSFRDSFDVFREFGAVVLGISSDSVETQRSFAATTRVPFGLLSDPGGLVRSAFGVPRTLGLVPGRMSLVINPAGKVVHSFSSQFRPQAHIDKALAFLTQQASQVAPAQDAPAPDRR